MYMPIKNPYICPPLKGCGMIQLAFCLLGIYKMGVSESKDLEA